MKSLLAILLILTSTTIIFSQDCAIVVPANPLTAQGLATPYIYQPLTGTVAATGCTMSVAPSFVEATIFDPATNKLSVYQPLVIDKGTTPAVAPTVPTIPKGAVVAIHFGSNANTLTLIGTGTSLQNGNCVNGIAGSVFGQFAYCNAPAFFKAATAAIAAKKLVVPPLGTGNDKFPCPTTRDFTIVDQDMSDNIETTYLLTANGQTAQNTMANRNKLFPNNNANVLVNPSDNIVLTNFVDPALGCTPWKVPNLGEPNGPMVSSLAVNELQAATLQAPPMALVPAGDPMAATTNAQGAVVPNMQKLNLYRAGVNQPQVTNLNQASTTAYCTNFYLLSLLKMKLDVPQLAAAPSPVPTATNLLNFLVQRYIGSYQILNCQNRLGVAAPMVFTTNSNGVVVQAQILDNAPSPTAQQIDPMLSDDGFALLNNISTTSMGTMTNTNSNNGMILMSCLMFLILCTLIL